MISQQTAVDIALAHREIATAEELLTKVREGMDRREEPDVRDAFGRRQGGLQLGVPSGSAAHTLYNVPWKLAIVVIEAHIAAQKSLIAALNEKARIELDESHGAQTSAAEG